MDNVDNLWIEHNFCAICQVYHKKKLYVILKNENFMNQKGIG